MATELSLSVLLPYIEDNDHTKKTKHFTCYFSAAPYIVMFAKESARDLAAGSEKTESKSSED